MHHLVRLVEQWRKQPIPEQLLVNRIREYLQVLILKSISHSKFGGCLAFMGGTALRICYDLKRFSEDLDFALDRPIKGYSFSRLMDAVERDFDANGYVVEVAATEEKTVHKAFVKLSKVLHPLGLSHREGQKIHIKVEVDTSPVLVGDDQLESFFITKFEEIFPILKHRTETLFAGKISAIFSRAYAKGRDYYDLIWYLTRKTEIDLTYLNGSMGQMKRSPFADAKEVYRHLGEVVTKVRPEEILKDIGRFLEDPAEERWIRDYQRLFRQLVSASG